MTASLRGHQRIERRSLALHRAIERWSLAAGRSQPYWDAWREILHRPLPEILSLLEEDSERMTALRQATPFAGALEPAERWAIYARFERDPAATT